MQETLSLYHIFYVTGRTGNISQAARELYISQPAISKAIQKLESALQCTLFKRSSRGVTLTEEGKALYEKAAAAFSLLEEGEALLQAQRTDRPRLRIGASTTLCKYVLLSHLKSYISRFPQVRITITCQSTFWTLRLLEEEKIDLGLIGRPKKLQGCRFYPLFPIRDVFVATQQYLDNQKLLFPDEPLSGTATFMMLDEENITRQSVNAQLREHHLELTHILEVSSMELLIQFAEIGLGIACVTREFVRQELSEGTLVEVPMGIDFPPREIGFVCRKKEADEPLLSPFLTSDLINC